MRPSGSKLATGRPWKILSMTTCLSLLPTIAQPGTAWDRGSQVLWGPTTSQFCPSFHLVLCRPQGSLIGSPPECSESLGGLQSDCNHLLLMPVEILQVLVVVQRHITDGMTLALLVRGVHNRVGGVREVNQVAAVLQRFHNLWHFWSNLGVYSTTSPVFQFLFHNRKWPSGHLPHWWLVSGHRRRSPRSWFSSRAEMFFQHCSWSTPPHPASSWSTRAVSSFLYCLFLSVFFAPSFSPLSFWRLLWKLLKIRLRLNKGCLRGTLQKPSIRWLVNLGLAVWIVMA